MAGRTEDRDGPGAPATRLLLSASVVVENAADEILLIRHVADDTWSLPGGAMRLGESLPAAAVRASRDETGVDVTVVGLVGIFSDPVDVVRDPHDGSVWQECSVVFAARPVGGAAAPRDESHQARWFSGGVASLRMNRSMRQRLDHYLTGGGRPHLG